MNSTDTKKLKFEYAYLIGLTAICSILAFLIVQLPLRVVSILIVIEALGLFLLWRKPLSKKICYMFNVLNVLAVLSLAYLLSTVVLKSMEGFLVFLIVVVVMDVFSFTKPGKGTLNARMIQSSDTVARVSICLPVPGKPGLQPIIGIGDLNFYSVITMVTIHWYGMHFFIYIFLLLLTGQIINNLIISRLIYKKWYKGFPATLAPGVFTVIMVLAL